MYYHDDDDDNVVELQEGDEVECGIIRSSIHTARRDHQDGFIRKGERYRVVVERFYRVGGPTWLRWSKSTIPWRPCPHPVVVERGRPGD